MNAAETWVDLYTIKNQTTKRGSLWMSESGVLEFIVIIGTTPKEVIQKWADISGHAPMPPYFALGYHQSKWNYMDAKELMEINEKFDRYGLPLDVLWLDIEVSFHIEKR